MKPIHSLLLFYYHAEHYSDPGLQPHTIIIVIVIYNEFYLSNDNDYYTCLYFIT